MSTRVKRVCTVVGSALVLTLACISEPARGLVQGWWKERGPVVPHDSFPSDCRICHEGDDWHTIVEAFQFDHLASTGTELVGAHAQAQCLRCHNDRGPVQGYAVRGCVGCHEDVHRGQLGANCTSCHDDEESTWVPREAIANHARTRFPLIGSHAAAPCFACHVGAEVGNFTRADPDCMNCHQDDLARATDPDHSALGFVSRCDRCHIPTSWDGAGFAHPASFPLTGQHAVIACDACHEGGSFGPLPTVCSACHLDDYAATTDPNHQAAGLPTSCELCHTTNAWDEVFFNHQGISRGCFECHAEDYQATTDPDHQAAGFPTSCQICHGTDTWFGATFDHGFDIDSGPHSSLSCMDCHMVPKAYAVFSCTHCHEHRQSEADDEHSEVRGYVYESKACFNCHPTGR